MVDFKKEETTKGFIYPVKPLIDALNAYDLAMLEVNKLWGEVQTERDISTLIHKEEKELEKVQMAFYEVTKDRNSMEHCKLADLDFMRKMAQFGNNSEDLISACHKKFKR
jgi:hypothetical protein